MNKTSIKGGYYIIDLKGQNINSIVHVDEDGHIFKDLSRVFGKKVILTNYTYETDTEYAYIELDNFAYNDALYKFFGGCNLIGSDGTSYPSQTAFIYLDEGVTAIEIFEV